VTKPNPTNRKLNHTNLNPTDPKHNRTNPISNSNLQNSGPSEWQTFGIQIKRRKKAEEELAKPGSSGKQVLKQRKVEEKMRPGSAFHCWSQDCFFCSFQSFNVLVWWPEGYLAVEKHLCHWLPSCHLRQVQEESWRTSQPRVTWKMAVKMKTEAYSYITTDSNTYF